MNEIQFRETGGGPFVGPEFVIRGPDLPLGPLAEGVPPPPISLLALDESRAYNTTFVLRADEIAVLQHLNCPMFTVTRTPEGLQIDCPSHKGD